MPEKAFKHVPKPVDPIGAISSGKMKVQDLSSGRESWRAVDHGLLKDYDGTPTAKNHNIQEMKKRPQHHVHFGNKSKASVAKEPQGNE